MTMIHTRVTARGRAIETGICAGLLVFTFALLAVCGYVTGQDEPAGQSCQATECP